MSFAQQPPFGPGSAFAAFPTSTTSRPPRRAPSTDDKQPHDSHQPPSHGAWEGDSREREREPSGGSDAHAHAHPRSFSSILSPGLPSNGEHAEERGGATERPFVYSREFLLSLYDDDKATARRPIELAHHDVATRSKPAKPLALKDGWRDGEKELFATSIHPQSSRSTRTSAPAAATTLDLGSLSPLPRPAARVDKRASKPAVVGILGGVLGGIGVPPARARAASPTVVERRREGSAGAKEVWQGGRWRRGAAADGEDDARPSAFGARRYPTSDAVPTTDARAPDEIPATWDGEDDDESPVPPSRTSHPSSALPTPPSSDGQPARQDTPPSPDVDLSHHATSILGSLALDEAEADDLLLRSVPPPGLAPPAAQDWQYRDPTGVVQGPFSALMMLDWYRRNFFASDLAVRRVHEREFEPLASLIRRAADPTSPFLSAPPQPVQLPPPTPTASWNAHPNGGGNGHPANGHGGFYEPFPSASPAFGGGIFGAQPTQQAALDPWGAPLPVAQPQQQWTDFASPGGQLSGYASPVADLFRHATYAEQPSPADQLFGLQGQQSASPFFDPSQLASLSQPDWSRLNGLPVQMPSNPLAQQQPIGPSSWTSMLPALAPVQPAFVQVPPANAWPPSPAPAPAPQPEPEPAPALPVQPAAIRAPTTTDRAIAHQQQQRQAQAQAQAETEVQAAASVPSPVVAPAPAPAAALPKPSPPSPILAPTPVVVAPVPTPSPAPRVSTPIASPAPWVADAESKPSLSLRQIQEIESRQAAADKLAASRAQALQNVAAAQRAAAEQLPESSTWAQSQQKQSKAAPWVAKVPAAAGKTLKEIQEEEERRKKAVAAAAAAANPTSAGPSGAQPRGYAASAKTAAPGAPWTTIPTKPPAAAAVAAAPKPVIPGGPVRSNGLPSKPVPARAQPPPPVPRPTPASAASPVYDAENPPPPSSEFLKWTRESLKGLSVNMDDFIHMLLSFPLDASADVLEIISDSVYANSSTLDGRRFANEYTARRRLDVAARYPQLIAAASKGKPASMAEALRLQAQPKPAEWNVKVAGGKKKKGGK